MRGVAELQRCPELRAFPAPPLRDLYAMRLDGPQIRARERRRHNLTPQARARSHGLGQPAQRCSVRVPVIVIGHSAEGDDRFR